MGVASFGGVLAYKIGLFDVVQAKTWDDVVEALTSNTPERTDEVVLVFERPSKDMPQRHCLDELPRRAVAWRGGVSGGVGGVSSPAASLGLVLALAGVAP